MRTTAANWRKPLQWNAQPFFECEACHWRGADPIRTQAGGVYCRKCTMDVIEPARRRVFCASLADVFDNEVDPQWRRDLFDLIRATPRLTWLLLTKRIGIARRLFDECHMDPPDGGSGYPWPENVWLGATICDQTEADRDIPKLLAVPARVRFLSIEPMLGPVDLALRCENWSDDIVMDPETGLRECCRDCDYTGVGNAIEWVICGGESGPQARDFNIAWPRSIVAQCKAAGVPVHVKQMGARPVWSNDPDDGSEPPHWGRISYIDKSGGDPGEWPADLRVQEFPA